MSEHLPTFPEYGEGGDLIGSRRSRRAFRWTAGAFLLLTLALWFSEGYLRYERAEQLYISAIELPPESGRNYLRQIEVTYAKQHKDPPAKYIEALAEREEDDLILGAYERAFHLEPNNSSLAIRYGCRLFYEGQAGVARLRFREAAENAQKNVLPVYLEASVLPWVSEASDDLGPSFAIIDRANKASGRVTVPKPLWSSALPERGYWYSKLRRQSAEACMWPFYQFADKVAAQAGDDIKNNTLGDWPERLKALETMGKRIAAGAVGQDPRMGDSLAGGIPQAQAGLHIMRTAVDLLKQISPEQRNIPDENMIKARVNLDRALEELTKFENSREDVIREDRQAYTLPLRLIAATIAVFLSVYMAAYILCKVFGVNSTHHNVTHSRVGHIVFTAWAAFSLALLILMAISHGGIVSSPIWHSTLYYSWWGGALVALAFSVPYPVLVLPSPRLLAGQKAALGDAESLLPVARRKYRQAYLSVFRRYLGILLGLTIISVSAWVVVFRIVSSLYPWQIGLLSTGLSGEEIETVQHALSLLG
ncbi:MAG: hypothetical protein K1Y02_09890 [Candidatus Hydrogenedentes bacterium]|nr:hypothetical protein [Candidatus Hydrogenedentota bacterium]